MTLRTTLLAGGAAAVSLFFISQVVIAQSTNSQSTNADDDVILKAMRDEMERSKQLRVVGGQDVPYFFSYDLTDAEDLTISATLGSALNVSREHVRVPGVEVRVGGYDFDNTGHIASGRSSGARYDSGWHLGRRVRTGILRECFWLATGLADTKHAVESMERARVHEPMLPSQV